MNCASRLAVWAVVWILSASGCLRIDEYTRTERGPLLGTATRAQTHPGRVEAEVDVRWPFLQLSLSASDVCRTQTIQTFNEVQVVERRSLATGPALSLGMSGLVAGAALWGFSYGASAEPEIDRLGRTGPSPQFLMRAWSVGALIVAVPALAVGILGALASGETTQSQPVEQVLSESDRPCHARVVSGPVAILASSHVVAVADAIDGNVQFDVTSFRSIPETIAFAGQPIALSETATQKLDALSSCLTTRDVEIDGLAGLTIEALGEVASHLRMCRSIRGDELRQRIDAVDAELVRRRGP